MNLRVSRMDVPTRSLLTVGFALSLSVVGGCGGDGDSSNPDTGTESAGDTDSSTSTDDSTETGIGDGDGDTGTSSGDGDGDGEASEHVVDVATSGVATCVVFQDGGVRCWGSQASGATGAPPSAELQPAPPASEWPAVDLGGKAVAIEGEGNVFCAVLDDGSFRCWGQGSYGVLGYGDEESVGDDESPAEAGPVPLGESVVQVDTSGEHTCALTDSGAIKCWGRSVDGTLGLGMGGQTLGDDEPISGIEAVDIGGVAVDLQVSGYVTCALRDDGKILCWGVNANGRLGLGHSDSLGNVSVDGTQLVTLGDRKAVSMSIGGTLSCALTEDDEVFCWGSNEFAALGYQNEVYVGDDETVESVGAAPLAGNVEYMKAWQTDRLCAVHDGGKLKCWGRNHFGRLGLGPDSGGELCPSAAPCNHMPSCCIGDDEEWASVIDVSVGFDVAGVEAGFNQICAYSTDGSLRCWGANDDGILGYGAEHEDIGDDERPSEVDPVPL